MQMMFKSMGIDIEGIEKLINPETVKQLLTNLERVTSDLTEIKTKLTRIEIRLETLPKDEAMKLLADGKDNAEQEATEYVRNYND